MILGNHLWAVLTVPQKIESLKFFDERPNAGSIVRRDVSVIRKGRWVRIMIVLPR